jgi:solute carrier family 13 (sodium-dependent dicarboxylate transporter), member 2/3/5
MIMSGPAASAMVIAAITPLSTSLGKQSKITKALLVGVPLAAIVGQMGTIIGCAPNAITVGVLEAELGIKVSFLDWMMFAVPVAIVLTAIGCFTLILIFLRDSTPIQKELIISKPVEQTKETMVKRRIVIGVLIITILLWLASSLLGITVASVTAVPLVIFTLTGIINSKEMRELPWDSLLLVAGGLSLGIALKHTELLNNYTDKIVAMGLKPLSLLIFFAFLATVIANFMSNGAMTTILVSLAFVMLPNLQKEAAIIVALATSTAVLLPVSDVPNVIAYSTGFLEQKDFIRSGVVIGLLGPLLVISWVLFVS